MSQHIPQTAMAWKVSGKNGLESLEFREGPVPELGDNQVLVKIHGVSLNFRDIMITQGQYPWTVKPDVIPGSDGAGTVLAVGKNVTRFAPGDEVVTMLLQQHLSGSIDSRGAEFGLGASVDGTLRSVGAFEELGLVRKPAGLTFVEAATLSCAGVTAWNALYGLEGKKVMPGQWVLATGTGGLSLFVVQFARAAGARVIATTGSKDKVQMLKELGAEHVINYRDEPEWGAAAKKLTGGVGVDIVVDVVGPTALKQSAACVKLDGLVSVVGAVGGFDAADGATVPTLLDCWMSLFTARGLWVGSRAQMEEMCRAVQGNVEKLRPVVDPKRFKLSETKEAYEYMSSGKNIGKVCIEID